MTVQAIDFRSTSGEGPAPLVNLQAEQAVLGAILYDNNALDHAPDALASEHFGEPFHQRLFEAMASKVRKGVLAEPVVMAQAFSGDAALEELGGLRYLADLMDKAPAPQAAKHFGEMVIDLHQKRVLLALCAEIGAMSRGGEQARDIVGHAEAALLALQIAGKGAQLVSVGEASVRVLEALQAPAEAGSVATGMAPLDKQLGPLLPGDLVLLAGRPSMGKSAFAECVGLNMARAGFGVIQINGEMSPDQMTRRHLTDIAFDRWTFDGPKYSDIRKRNVTADQMQMLYWAHEQLNALPIEMLKKPGLRLAQLRSLVRRQAAVWARRAVPLGALFIDHVGLLRTDTRMDRYEAQTEISNGLKELADELQCVVVGLNQLNRETEKREDKRPQLSDLRDSGSWEQDADFVIGFYREAYYASRQPEPKGDLNWSEWDRARKSRTVEALVLKAREGECGTVSLWGDVARNAIRGAPPEGDLL